jgi:hypothetical protein
MSAPVYRRGPRMAYGPRRRFAASKTPAAAAASLLARKRPRRRPPMLHRRAVVRRFVPTFVSGVLQPVYLSEGDSVAVGIYGDAPVEGVS